MNCLVPWKVLVTSREQIVSPKYGGLADNNFHRWELLALREKIKEMEQRQVKVESSRLVHSDELKHLISEFSDGLGINRWIDTIRHNSELYEWQNRTTLLYAGSRLTGVTNACVETAPTGLPTLECRVDCIQFYLYH